MFYRNLPEIMNKFSIKILQDTKSKYISSILYHFYTSGEFTKKEIKKAT